MTSINTNLSSLIVQRNLTKSTNSLNQAIERLTTGYKINHASDNAANYSISESMTSKLSSYMVAEENTSMGLDLIRTQSLTLDTIQNLTTRLRALAEQAHNGTYGAQSLDAINQEANAIIEEITRIGNNAEYNGIKLFDNAISESGIPQLKSNGLMQEIERRDTSSMTKLSSVDETEVLAAGTYSISSAEELAKLAAMQNDGKITDGSEFVLGADIDLSAYSEGSGWTPIGRSRSGFKGIFDGNGYTVSDLYINTEYTAGLFGRVEGATIKNLILKNCDINVSGTRDINAGILIAECSDSINDSTKFTSILNCSVSGNINNTANGNTGLIVGYSYSPFNGYLENCYTSGVVKGNADTGGIAGNIKGIITVSNCVSDAYIVSVSGDAGGLFGYVGYLEKVQDSAFLGRVHGNSYVGGIAGSMSRSGKAYNIENVGVFAESISSDEDYLGYIAGGINGHRNMEINGVFDSSLTGNLNIFGDNDEGTNLTVNMRDVSSGLQVGVDSTESSTIKFTTNISLSSIASIRGGMEGANSLERIDSFISKLSDAQTKLGAIENRLTSTIESIGVNIENLTSSRSTLKDADVAKESSQMLKNQILQQASATLLATANQTPSLALRLLGGIQ